MTNNEETTGIIDPAFVGWMQELNDTAANNPIAQRKMIRDRILLSNEFSEADRQLFNTVYDYVEKVYSQGKPLEPNLLKIYLHDLKGYDIDNVSIVRILCLVSLCGFSFDNFQTK